MKKLHACVAAVLALLPGCTRTKDCSFDVDIACKSASEAAFEAPGVDDTARQPLQTRVYDASKQAGSRAGTVK